MFYRDRLSVLQVLRPQQEYIRIKVILCRVDEPHLSEAYPVPPSGGFHNEILNGIDVRQTESG